jgi:hypothetical protein
MMPEAAFVQKRQKYTENPVFAGFGGEHRSLIGSCKVGRFISFWQGGILG